MFSCANLCKPIIHLCLGKNVIIFQRKIWKEEKTKVFTPESEILLDLKQTKNLHIYFLHLNTF